VTSVGGMENPQSYHEKRGKFRQQVEMAIITLSHDIVHRAGENLSQGHMWFGTLRAWKEPTFHGEAPGLPEVKRENATAEKSGESSVPKNQ